MAPEPLIDAAVWRGLQDTAGADFATERAGTFLEEAPLLLSELALAHAQDDAGYTGTQQRATCTCVGNAVNLAARLEAHTKQAARTILIDARARRTLAAGGRWKRWVRCR